MNICQNTVIIVCYVALNDPTIHIIPNIITYSHQVHEQLGPSMLSAEQLAIGPIVTVIC